MILKVSFPLLFLFAASALFAQSNIARTDPVHVQTFEFSRPKTLIDLGKMPVIAARFECTQDGNLVTVADTVNGPPIQSGDQETVVSIKPDGETVRLKWKEIPGFASVSIPRNIFAGNSSVYVMAIAAKGGSDEADIPVLEEFDGEGSLKRVVSIEPSIHPISFGVFPSGNYLILSEDRLNYRMEISILDTNGKFLRDIDVRDADYISHMGPHATGPEGPVTYEPRALLELTQIYPYQKNLLLVPHGTSSVPILEISETGIVRATTPKLPRGTVNEMFIPSTGATFKVQLGTLYDNSHQLIAADGHFLGATIKPSHSIVEVDPSDGHVLRQMEVSAGSQPACESQGVFTFLTGDKETGFLEIVLGKPR